MPDTVPTPQQQAWVSRVLGVALAPGVDALGRDAGRDGLGAWRQARAEAVATLNRLADAVSGLDIPEAANAVILLRAIRANLTEAPTSPQQIGEMRRYLTTDDIIADAEDPNGFGIEVRLREPLLAALDRIAVQEPGAGARQ